MTSKFCPLGLSVPDLWIHLLDHEKMCIKSEVKEILFKLITNGHSDEAFLLTSKLWSCHCLRAMFKLLFLSNR